jgi:hypothetical protein
MRRAVRLALIAVSFVPGFVVFSLRGWGQQEVFVPGKDATGYSFSKTDDKVKAPEGYVGDTDKPTQTYTGNTPATDGKVFFMKSTLGNQIKICPKSDGTSEGDGEFSFSVEYSDKQGNAGHVTMDAKAKYKGKVGDNALLDGPVKADIDYTFSQSGSFPDKSGVIFSPPAMNVQQHVTMDITVMPGMNVPGLSNIVESALPQDSISNAFLASAALAHFGGFYYSVAETMWIDGNCVQVAFDPPSHTVNPPPGTQVKVKTQVKAKDGEITKAHLVDARAFAGSSVDPAGGVSEVGTPMTFTYTAPSQKSTSTSKPGFHVDVVSRAGATNIRNPGDWEAGLGKDWSGTMTCRTESWGDEGGTPPWGYLSNSAVHQFTIDVVDGVGTLVGYAEQKSAREARQPVADGTTKLIERSSSQGTASGAARATVYVDIDKEHGTYSISWEAASIPIGKSHWVSCGPDSCKEGDRDLPVNPGGCEGSGDLSDPNHVQGSMSDLKSNVGSTGKGKQLWTQSWNFARQGATK